MKKTFTIYGSCVVRDVFNFLDNEIYVPALTIGGGTNSIPTLFGNGLNIDFEDIQIGSKFANRMIYYNLTRKALHEVQSKISDYFVFDLATERLPLQNWTLENTTVEIPNSWNIYRLSKSLQEKFPDLRISNWHLSDQNKIKYKEELIRFSNEIKKLYSQEKIIYFSVQQIDEILEEESQRIRSLTVDKNQFSDGIDSIGLRIRQNKIICYAEEIILKEIPNCWVIPMPKFVLGNALHHFGPHPLHFDYLLYEYFAEALKLIVKEPDTEIERSVVCKNINYLCKRYEDKFLKTRIWTESPKSKHIQFCGTKEFQHIFEKNTDVLMKGTITNTSITSILSSPINIIKNDIVDMIPEGERVRLLNDVRKTNKEMLLHNCESWLVIDFISECFDVISIGNDKIMMANYGERFNHYIYDKFSDKKIDILQFNKMDEEQLLNNITRFVSEILMQYTTEKIIIVEAYFKEMYVESDFKVLNYNNVQHKNKFLRKCYEIIFKNIPDCKVVKMPINLVSYSKDNPLYMSQIEIEYYQRAFEMILNKEEKLLEPLFNEFNLKNTLLLEKISNSSN